MTMQIRQHLFLIMAITIGWLLPDLAQSASTIYYCPDRKSDQQYSSRPAPGCAPLVDEKQPSQGDDSLQPQRVPTDFKIENLQSDVSAFLNRYHQLLECCKTDVSARTSSGALAFMNAYRAGCLWRSTRWPFLIYRAPFRRALRLV